MVFEPDTDERGVPYCNHDDCEEYDGKRCRMLGSRPSHLCEPAVAEMAAELNRVTARLVGTVTR